jgi:2-polyprenyl-6-methoxyphenol hydroxylase-like FAD-dependent oxidoreductase
MTMKVIVNNDNNNSYPSGESSYIPSNRKKRRKHERLDKVSSQIVIVGSGLGGLSAARSLELAGFQNIRILEQRNSDPQSREGYGLTLTYNPQGPLAYLGILEEVAQNDCPSRSHYTFDPLGHVLGYYGNAFRPEGGRGQRGNLRVPRMLVRNILRQQVQSPILYGKQVAAVEVQSSTSVTLLLNDGSQLSNIDLVIAADGIRSSVLKSILPPDDTKSALQSLGIFVILGIADFCHPLVDERGFYTLDGHHRLFTMPYEGSRISTNQRRRVMWQLSFPTVDYINDDISKNNNIYDDEQSLLLHRHDSKFLRGQVLKRCQGWHDPVLPMIHATPLETIWGT